MGMNREDLHKYLSDADILNRQSAVELKETIGKYPYCSLLYLLLARAHRNEGDSQLQEVVQKAAAYSPDREGLYLFLHASGSKSEGRKMAAPEPPDQALPEETLAEEAPAEAAPVEEVPAEEAPGEEASAEAARAEEARAEEARAEGASNEEMPPAETSVEEAVDATAVDATAVEASPEAARVGENEKHATTSLEKAKAGPRDIALNIDDQLPRTFTFWLRRIRQVTEGEPDHSVKISDVLEKNYYQELITRKTEKEYLSSSPVQFDLKKKEDRIIARFIEEDPQVIKPTVIIHAKESSSEINESEEEDEVISETLAQIYIDQDLTDKAIRVYEKLSLKFPEKSAYFAGLIEKLKK